jgi:NAD(P)-dependent dehydrogenase (short-subunit alcohol dehydrogenase family)
VLAVEYRPEAAQETQRVIEGEGRLCMAFRADVSNSEDVRRMVAACIETYGRVDVLHNNVGIVETGGPIETSEESSTLNFVMHAN